MTSLLRKIWPRKAVEVKTNDRMYTEEGYYKTYKVPLFVLSFTGIQMSHKISDLRSKCWSFRYWSEVVAICLSIPSLFLAMIVAAKAASSFYEGAPDVFKTMPIFGAYLLALTKSLKLKLNRQVFENLFYELQKMWPRGEISAQEHCLINAAMKELHVSATAFFWCNNAMLVSFLAPANFISLKRLLGYDTRMVLFLEFWLPFDVFQPGVFEFILFLQSWGGTVVDWWNVGWDILFCSYLTHITAQFDLLSRRIRKLIYVPVDQQLEKSTPLAQVSEEFLQDEKDILNSYSIHDWEFRHRRELTDIVQTHNRLIKLAEDVEAMFSFGLLVNFMYGCIIICFSGVCCVLVEKWNETSYKTLLSATLLQMWLLCWYGQKLHDSSTGIAEALYESGWYNGAKKIRSSILIMLQRSQKGIHVTTYGFSNISLASFSTIIKTSWSYFTLLLNFFAGSRDEMMQA